MLNEVHLEGIVTRGGWAFGGASFIRLAVYRDDDRPRKVRPGSQDRQDEADYVTLRCEGHLALAAQALKVGARVRASGTLITRDYEIPLSRFAAEAQAPDKGQTNLSALAELKQVAGQFGRDLVLGHSLTEILVLRLLPVAEPDRADAPFAVAGPRFRAAVGTSTDGRPATAPVRRNGDAPRAARRQAADVSAANVSLADAPAAGEPAAPEGAAHAPAAADAAAANPGTAADVSGAGAPAPAGVTLTLGATPSLDGWATTVSTG